MKPFLVVLPGDGGLWISETADKARIMLAPVTLDDLAARFPRLADRLRATRSLEAPRIVVEVEDRSTFLW
jgi:hypothetical protein